jgi:hypothetical protein
MSKKRSQYHGWFCWCCGRFRANEGFSSRGHVEHVCRDCARLGREELDYRQHVRDIENTLGWDGGIRRQQRKAFERYLEHPNPRVRAFAVQIQHRGENVREGYRVRMEADALLEEELASCRPPSPEEWQANYRRPALKTIPGQADLNPVTGPPSLAARHLCPWPEWCNLNI